MNNNQFNNDQFPQRELFGGAITSNIMNNFEDLNNYRPVFLLLYYFYLCYLCY